MNLEPTPSLDLNDDLLILAFPSSGTWWDDDPEASAALSLTVYHNQLRAAGSVASQEAL